MSFNLTPAHIKAWQPNTPDAFRFFLKNVQPRILHRGGRFEPFAPTPNQDNLIDKILEPDGKGGFKHSISLVIEPRRHGKSALMCCILIWLFFSRKNFTIGLLGNSELHCRRVQFQTLKKIIENSPILSSSMQDQFFRNFDISFPPLGNIIQVVPLNTSVAFGDRISCLYIADYHAVAVSDLSVHNAVQASLLDSENSLMLIDANVDATDGHVHSLQREADTDHAIFCKHLFYRDFAHFKKEAPVWIDRARAKRLKATVLPVDFKRDILGQRSDARNALFPSEVIEQCKSDYNIPVADIHAITQGRSYKVGAGLDRSRNLFQSERSDATVLTTILKTVSHSTSEAEFYILNQQKINPNLSRLIKRAILKDHERYKLDNLCLENFETADLAPWLTDQQIPHELVGGYSTEQNTSFPEFYRLCKENRFHIPEMCKDLISEMRTFVYVQRGGQKYSFGHSSSKFHDDFVFSTNYSIYSLRTSILNLFRIRNIQCTSKSRHRNACYLMGGDRQLFCSEGCEAHHKVYGMFKTFKAHQMDSSLTLSEFFHSRVRLTGARIRQAV